MIKIHEKTLESIALEIAVQFFPADEAQLELLAARIETALHRVRVAAMQECVVALRTPAPRKEEVAS